MHPPTDSQFDTQLLRPCLVESGWGFCPTTIADLGGPSFFGYFGNLRISLQSLLPFFASLDRNFVAESCKRFHNRCIGPI